MEKFSPKIFDYITDYGKSVEKIRIAFEEYIKYSGIKSIVIGVSGGIDSALVCALAKPVCDKAGIPMIGRSISIITNKPDEESRANAVGMAFCHDFENIDMSSEFNAMMNSVEPQGENESDRQYKIRLGNVKARLRMIKLYDLAQANGGLVMSTDNLTELLLGFFTLNGDVGDLGIMQQLWKTEVYKMAQYLVDNELSGKDTAGALALLDCVKCNATDGLGITNTDLDQILPDWRERHTSTSTGYHEVDEKLIAYIQKREDYDGLVPTRMRKSAFKRNHPFNFSREQIFA